MRIRHLRSFRILIQMLEFNFCKMKTFLAENGMFLSEFFLNRCRIRMLVIDPDPTVTSSRIRIQAGNYFRIRADLEPLY